MTVEATTRQRLQILQSLIIGVTPTEFAAENDMTVDQVRDIAALHGYPYTQSMRAAVAALKQKLAKEAAEQHTQAQPVRQGVVDPVDIGQILGDAERHSVARIRTKAGQIRGALAQLQQMLDAEREAEQERQKQEAERRAALERIAELEAEINRVRVKAGLKPRKGPRSDRTGTRSGQTPRQHAGAIGGARAKQDEWLAERGVTFEQVKEWAATTEQPVNSSIIAWSIRWAWDQAHQETAA